MKKIIFAFLFFSIQSFGQRNEIFDSNIASLRVIAGDNWQGMPVINLNDEEINISFDELSHEYHRYKYTVQHYEHDWKPSESLFPSDYLSGFYDDNTIDDYSESVGTYQQYTHYSLNLPNDRCKIKMSGNYKLSVIDDNTQKIVLEACFMVNEGISPIMLGVTTNTGMGINDRFQQVNMQILYGNINVTSPDEQLKTVVLQNQRWDSAIFNPDAQFKMRDGLKWEHNKNLIFAGGTEYHKFETLNPSHTTLGIATIGWDKELSQWHAYLYPDIPAISYTYDVDANGSYLIRNSDNFDNDISCDYILTHFELHSPKQSGKVYINGVWTSDRFTSQYEMDWNDEKNIYEKSILLKQGYYSYRYLLMNSNGELQSIIPEGDFFETENTYQALLYFKGPTDRAERLVGFTSFSSKN